jgi:hypothetical protein
LRRSRPCEKQFGAANFILAGRRLAASVHGRRGERGVLPGRGIVRIGARRRHNRHCWTLSPAPSIRREVMSGQQVVAVARFHRHVRRQQPDSLQKSRRQRHRLQRVVKPTVVPIRLRRGVVRQRGSWFNKHGKLPQLPGRRAQHQARRPSRINTFNRLDATARPAPATQPANARAPGSLATAPCPAAHQARSPSLGASARRRPQAAATRAAPSEAPLVPVASRR